MNSFGILSDHAFTHVKAWSDNIPNEFINQLFSVDCWGSCSGGVTNERRDWASSRRNGSFNESAGEGSAQSVHSLATLNVPQSSPRRMSVSLPAMRRFFSTGKR